MTTHNNPSLNTAAAHISATRNRAKTDPTQIPPLVDALTTYSTALANAGHHQDSYTAANEAVETAHLIPTTHPQRLVLLASALNELATRAREQEHHTEALNASKQAAETYSELAATNPHTYLPKLITAVTGLSHDLEKNGKTDEALSVSIETLNLRRQLANLNETELPDFAAALLTLSRKTSGKESAGLIHEATQIYRHLSEQNPDTYNPHLAAALSTLADALDAIDQPNDALIASTEAVDFYQHLNDKPLLSIALQRHCERLDKLGLTQQSLEARLTSAKLLHELVQHNPDHLAPYAQTLTELSTALHQAGRLTEARAAAVKAVNAQRELANDTEESQAMLSDSLLELGHIHDISGQHLEADIVIKEAITIRRQLTENNPNYLASLGQALAASAEQHTRAGNGENAIRRWRETINTYRRATQRDKNETPALGHAIHNLTTALTNTGHYRDALNTTEETVALFYQLSQENPDDHLADFASALYTHASVRHALGTELERALSMARNSLRFFDKLNDVTNGAFVENSEVARNLIIDIESRLV